MVFQSARVESSQSPVVSCVFIVGRDMKQWERFPWFFLWCVGSIVPSFYWMAHQRWGEDRALRQEIKRLEAPHTWALSVMLSAFVCLSACVVLAGLGLGALMGLWLFPAFPWAAILTAWPLGVLAAHWIGPHENSNRAFVHATVASLRRRF